MNQERKEELIVRWIDDEMLSASEKEELTLDLGGRAGIASDA